MPNLPISGLPVVTVPNRAYTVAAVSASVTSQMTLAQVAAAISSSFTASQAISASYAVSASYEINIETSSSYADTASFVTGSNVYGPFGSNSIISSSYAVSASYAPAQVSASYATTASYAITASYAVSASYAPASVSSSYALTASYWDGGSSYVPYTGATTNVNLGGNDLIADNVLISPAGYGLLAALSRDLTGAGFGSLVLKNGATGYLIPTSSLTVDRYYLLPDKSGTVAMLSDITASVTASYAITSSHALSAVITGSSLGSTLTFTKGDGSTFNLYTTPGGAFPVNYGLFNQTGSSIPVLGTTPSGSLLDGGIGTLSVPANGFIKGDAYRATLYGKLTSGNGHGLEITVSSNGITLVDTGVITMPGVTNQNWKLDLDFSINEVGGAGTAAISSAGLFTFRTNSSGDVVTEIFSNTNNTTFDTTTGNTLEIKAIWSGGNGSDSIYSTIATLKKTY